jgi:hypothetical protein
MTLAMVGHPKQRLVGEPVGQPADQCLDGLRLVSGRLHVGNKLKRISHGTISKVSEFAYDYGLVPPSITG